jgi:hypothetical protein
MSSSKFVNTVTGDDAARRDALIDKHQADVDAAIERARRHAMPFNVVGVVVDEVRGVRLASLAELPFDVGAFINYTPPGCVSIVVAPKGSVITVCREPLKGEVRTVRDDAIAVGWSADEIDRLLEELSIDADITSIDARGLTVGSGDELVRYDLLEMPDGRRFALVDLGDDERWVPERQPDGSWAPTTVKMPKGAAS